MTPFPAPAGMNRLQPFNYPPCTTVPRTRGDEPIIPVRYFFYRFRSPHPRG